MHHTCPHHGDALVRHPVDGTVTWRCDRCEGIWLPGRMVERVVGSAPNWPAREDTAATTLRCPDDAKPLRAVDADGIELDLCVHCHGLWLDRGELARILDRRRDTDDDVDIEGTLEDLLDCGSDGGDIPSGGTARVRSGGARKDADTDAPTPASGGSKPGAADPQPGGPPAASLGPAQQHAALQAQPSSSAAFDVERGATGAPSSGGASLADIDTGALDGIGDVASGAAQALGAVFEFIGDIFSAV